MGIAPTSSRFLLYARRLGVDYSCSVMLGRQTMFVENHEVRSQADAILGPEAASDFASLSDVRNEYAEPLFKCLGAKQVDSIDVSAYENATIIHDMNMPLPQQLANNYSAVFDGGTLEHIFNFPVAISNAMRMVNVGGHFIGITPSNNQFGHGFYQFSPELFFRVFSSENGFQVIKMMVVAGRTDREEGEWFEVSDPEVVRSRVTLVNSLPVDIMVIAKKISDVVPFAQPPQQSDYSFIWAASAATTGQDTKLTGDGKLKKLYRTVVPRPLRYALRLLLHQARQATLKEADIGVYDPRYFKRVEV